jgi:hypothetical protein
MVMIFIGFANVHFATKLLNTKEDDSNKPLKNYIQPKQNQQQQQTGAKAAPKSSTAARRIQTTNTDVDKNNKNKANGHGSTAPNNGMLIVAAVPRSIKHVVALWSELECFTHDVNRVVISGPTWSTRIITQIIESAKHSIPQFASSVGLENMTSFINNRYDVGLWCDALETIKNEQDGDGLSMYDGIGLLNDSVFAVRQYTDILQSLKTKNVSMTSLSYSYYGPSFKGYGPEHYWLESVWRGFNTRGISKFVEYSCRPVSDRLFCPVSRGWKKKACIIDNFERAMGQQFPKEETYGLFPSDTPKHWLTQGYSFQTWARHPNYWRELVQNGFPVSKVNYPQMIDSIDDDRLKTCTKYLDRSLLDKLDFSVVKKGK